MNLLLCFSFRLVVETTQTKDAMGRFLQQSSFSNPVHRTGVSMLTTKSENGGALPSRRYAPSVHEHENGSRFSSFDDLLKLPLLHLRPFQLRRNLRHGFRERQGPFSQRPEPLPRMRGRGGNASLPTLHRVMRHPARRGLTRPTLKNVSRSPHRRECGPHPKERENHLPPYTKTCD